MAQFFRRYSGKSSFGFFSNYSFSMPSLSGVFWIFILFILGNILGSIVQLVLLGLDKESAEIYGNIIVYPIMFIPAMIYSSVQSQRNAIFSTGYKMDSNNFGKFGFFGLALPVMFMTIATAFLCEPVNMLLPEMPESLVQMMENMIEGPLWVTLLSVSIYAPFFEEWLCRGLILRGLLKRMKPRWAIVISAAFFALIHMNPWQAIPAFVMGLVFGYVYYRTGSLKLTMLMHFTNNTMVVILSKIPSLATAETMGDVLSPIAYIGILICSASIILSGLLMFRSIPLKYKDGAGNCDEIKSEMI